MLYNPVPDKLKKLALGFIPPSDVASIKDEHSEPLYAIRYINLLYNARTIAYLEIDLYHKPKTYHRKADKGLIQRERVERWSKYPKIIKRVLKHELNNSDLVNIRSGGLPPAWLVKYFSALSRLISVPDEQLPTVIDKILTEPDIAASFGGLTGKNPYTRAKEGFNVDRIAG